MQAEIEAPDGPSPGFLPSTPGLSALEIRIFGVNGIGQESGNAAVCAGRSTPWLQDVSAEDVWVTWAVTYRDVVILDDANNVRAVYNLTDHDLSNPANYAALRNLLIEAAGE